jgi:formylglycine-generating enzyme required for sulfatase activity
MASSPGYAEGQVRFLHIIAVTWLMLACTLAPAHAEKRVALVVGNAAYRHADRLANPVNDARGVRDALTALRFDVTYGEDLDQNGLRRAIGQFADRVGDADVAMVYFAGHGATFGDVPYVVPVDAEFSSLGQVPYQLVPVETLIGELRQAKGVRIVILDACRDNAAEQELKRQASRGGPVPRGLAPVKNPGGLIIAYATQSLSTAAADAGGGGLFSLGSSSASHSPFTAALLSNIATPGLDVKDMFYKVGRDVIATTEGKQRPEISISMYDQYALVTGAKPAEMKPVETSPPPVGNTLAAEAAQAWVIIQNTTSLAVVDEFIAHYGTVPVYGALARTKREELVTPRLTAAQERGLKAKDAFRECTDCPEMVVVPAGSFTMGWANYAKPQHLVTIGRAFAVGRYAVTRDQFAVFVNETGYTTHSECDWRNPGFAQDGTHTVVCVTWDDANAYANWLSKKTGRPYRLPSEAEWEYAARAGTPFWYDPAPVTTAHPWGLYNVGDTVWTADCWHDSYIGAPSDGSAWTTTCERSARVVRGGVCFADIRFSDIEKPFTPHMERSHCHNGRFFGSNVGSHNLGIRVAKTLTP